MGIFAHLAAETVFLQKHHVFFIQIVRVFFEVTPIWTGLSCDSNLFHKLAAAQTGQGRGF